MALSKAALVGVLTACTYSLCANARAQEGAPDVRDRVIDGSAYSAAKKFTSRFLDVGEYDSPDSSLGITRSKKKGNVMIDSENNRNQLLFGDRRGIEEVEEDLKRGTNSIGKRGLRLPPHHHRQIHQPTPSTDAEIRQSVRSMRAADLPSSGDVAALDEIFEAFILEYNRTYSGPEEKARRRIYFEANVAAARAQQASDPSAVYGVTHLMDEDMVSLHSRRRRGFEVFFKDQMREGSLSGEDGESTFIDPEAIGTSAAAAFLAKFTSEKEKANIEESGPRQSLPLDDGEVEEENRKFMKPAATVSAIDWRNYGVVSPVKNQGNCGSCWSFSVTGNIEALWVISGNNATLLSEEELIACDNKGHNEGCEGGLMQAAFYWIRKYRNGYLSSGESYPFTSGTGRTASCDVSRSRPGAYISDWGEIRRNEQSLASAVSKIGPVSIGIDSRSWDFYKGGIMTACITQTLDHAALVVGFDSNNNPPYWIVKNSWGPLWGENGYIRIKMGLNLCLIADIPCTAIVPPGPVALPAFVITTPEPSSAPSRLSVFATAFTFTVTTVFTYYFFD